jgi:hypothetical protein
VTVSHRTNKGQVVVVVATHNATAFVDYYPDTGKNPGPGNFPFKLITPGKSFLLVSFGFAQ